MDSPEFAKLMQIEDPTTYLTKARYRKRMAIPKYIISASGDDFFAADSLSQYLPLLPGENSLRALPNQRHYVDMGLVSSAIGDYYQRLVTGKQVPSVGWQQDDAGRLLSVNSDRVPQQAVLWTAHNPALRDFRLASGITYYEQPLTLDCPSAPCQIAVPAIVGDDGFYARFVELKYAAPASSIILTTAIAVSEKAPVVSLQ